MSQRRHDPGIAARLPLCGAASHNDGLGVWRQSLHRLRAQRVWAHASHDNLRNSVLDGSHHAR